MLRCGAGNEWIQGKVADEPVETEHELIEELSTISGLPYEKIKAALSSPEIQAIVNMYWEKALRAQGLDV